MTTIVIEIEGGQLQSVFSDNESVNVVLYDFDNAEAEGFIDDLRREFNEVTEGGMVPVW